jgi:hypothetical protein
MPSSSNSQNVNMSVFEKSKTSKKENDKRKYKKSNNSDGENSADDDNYKSDSESSVRDQKKGDKSKKKTINKSKSGKKVNGGNGAGAQSDEQQFDMQEYRKMLADMFPSKYMTKRVENIENSKERAVDSICKDLNIETQEKHFDECDSRVSKNNENKKGKNTGSDEKRNKTTDKKRGKSDKEKEKENNKTSGNNKNKYNTRSKAKKRGSNNPEPPLPSTDDEEDGSGSDNQTWRTASGSGSSTSTSTTCSDDSGDETYEPGFNEFAKDQLKNGKFNIVINLVDDKRRHSDSDSENEDDEEDYDSEYDDEDDDSEYDSEYDEYEDDESDSDNDRESDLDYEPSETSEETDVYDPKRGHEHGHRHGHKHYSKDKDSRSEKNKKKDDTTSSIGNSSDSLETILRIKQQMEDILKINKHDSIARETLQSMIRKEKEFKEREERKLRSHKKKHVKNFKKLLRQKNSTNDLKYFKEHLSMDEQTAVLSELQCLNKLTITDKPYRLALLQSNIPQEFKAIALKKITNLRRMEPGAGEYYKIKNWVDTFMQIPFGKISNLPLTISDGIEKCHEFMEDAKSKLDGAVYGLNDAKMQIMQMLGQWISNPSAMGTAIAINGPMGTGKTSLVKDGISKILNREFAFIPLGGATDSSYLEGHSYTYEGSTWGKIVDILIRSKSMNPVIYFDELDKISETPKGEEIIGILTHLTDTSQNSQFHDKYFAEIDFDLSKCLFIFSYNDPMKVNPILMDRMYKIKTSSYSGKEKIVIANQYLIPKIRYEVNFKEGDIVIPDTTLNYIIENYTDKECGVRNLKRCIEIIYKKLNLYRLVKPGTTLFEKENTLVVEFPFHVTTDVVNNLIKKDESGMSKSAINMYL